MKNLLMLHGNGGAAVRFKLFVDQVQEKNPDLNVVIPSLPGFEGRPITVPSDAWGGFLKAISDIVLPKKDEEWIFYGHGIGGSILLEWAARSWTLSNGASFQPQQLILHGCIGASLKERWFPFMMKPKVVRTMIRWLIWQPWLRPLWEKKLFLYPDKIPEQLKDQFFWNYKNCTAFSLFFDLITPEWYEGVIEKVGNEPFYFIWGDKERVVASRYVDLWKKDFPNATFEIIPGWDHFPMLEQPDEFYSKMMDLLN